MEARDLGRAAGDFHIWSLCFLSSGTFFSTNVFFGATTSFIFSVPVLTSLANCIFNEKNWRLCSGSHNFLVLFSFPGRSQWGGGVVLPGRLSLEGASVYPGEGAQGGDAHQVRPLPWPELSVEGPVRPRGAQHLPEQVRLHPKSIFSSISLKVILMPFLLHEVHLVISCAEGAPCMSYLGRNQTCRTRTDVVTLIHTQEILPDRISLNVGGEHSDRHRSGVSQTCWSELSSGDGDEP